MTVSFASENMVGATAVSAEIPIYTGPVLNVAGTAAVPAVALSVATAGLSFAGASGATEAIVTSVNASAMQRVGVTGVRIATDVAAAADTLLDVVGAAATNLPVVTVTQGDDNEPFINYVGTSAGDATKNISTLTVAAIGGYARVAINGTDKWIPFYADPSA